MSQILLLSDMPHYAMPSKTAGIYRIASTARKEGFSAEVLDHFMYLLFNYPEEVKNITRSILGDGGIILGISASWFIDLEKFDADRYISFDRNRKFNSVADTLSEYFEFIRKEFPHVKIVAGGHGWGLSAVTKNFEKYIDHIVTGFGEKGFSIIANGIANNIINIPKKIDDVDKQGTYINLHDSDPMFDPEHDVIIPGEVLPLELSRGCRFKCKFCAFPLLGKNPNDLSYLRNKESIKRELQQNYEAWGTTDYFVVCDTFNESEHKMRFVADALDELKLEINIIAYTRLDLVHRHWDVQAPLLDRVGLKAAAIGIETLNDQAGKAIGKGMGRKRVEEALGMMRNKWGKNIHLHSNFICGLPYETPETYFSWVEDVMYKRNGIDLDSFSLYALSINHPGARVDFASEFDLNAEKYGYTHNANGAGWTNEFWDSSISSTTVRHLAARARDEKLTRVDAWATMSLRNYQLSWEECFSTTYPDLTSEKMLNLKIDYFERYVALLKKKYLG